MLLENLKFISSQIQTWVKQILVQEKNNSIKIEVGQKEEYIPPVIITQFKLYTSKSHIYISRSGDEEKIKKLRMFLKGFTHQQLVDGYNEIDQIEGDHRQALLLIALNQEFIHRFRKTPICIQDKFIISLGRKVVYSKHLQNIINLEVN